MNLSIAVPPGLTLAESLQASGLTQSDLARRTGLHRKTINGIVNGSEPITPETALHFERIFQVPARFWIALQSNYDEALARQAARARLAGQVGWLDDTEIPVGELARRGAIAKTRDPIERLESVLAFFGVSSPAEFAEVWRKTEVVYSVCKSARHPARFGAVAAWLRQGEALAAKVECAPFGRKLLHDAIDGIDALVSDGVEPMDDRVGDALAQCGVALVFVPAMPGAPIHGATRWLTSSKAIVQMCLRGKGERIWFALYRELGHVLLHGKTDIFLDLDHGRQSKKEEEAIGFARERVGLATAV